jgi:CheY-like chemotaxis protein
MPSKIVAVLTDLMFTIKISDAAKRAGVPVEFARTADEALKKAEGAAAVILDLNFVPLELITRLKPIPLIGYVSHVQADVIRQAREKGCDTVMARSAFVLGLGKMMEGFATRA